MVANRHSVRTAERPRLWKRSILRLNFTSAKTGSTIAWRRSYRCQVRAGDAEAWAPHMMVAVWRGGRGGVGEVGAQRVVDLAGDVALEAAHDLALGLAFGGASLRVGAGALAVAQAADGDQVQGSVGLAVAAVVEAVAGWFCPRRRGPGWRRRARRTRPRRGAGRCSAQR